ncbi:MAG: DegV family protein [Anaerolineae bacterium]|jgi:DegV family protein with EDD domain
MAYSIALIGDSACDLPDDLLMHYEIALVPTYVVWGDEQLRDRIDITAEQFYRRLTEDQTLPTTAQPAPEAYVSVYRQAIEAGAREIVVIALSSALSGTIQSARLAAEMVDVPVHIVDSKGPTMTEGWQLLAAARAREKGADAAGMVAAAEAARAGMVQCVVLDTLEYLHRGGRIGGASAFVGALLNIKPLVYIDHEKGTVEAGERVRTRKRSIEALYQLFFRQLDTSRRTLHIAVLHGNARSEAEDLAERIRQEYAPTELLITTTSPVLGVHTGPGALALCGYSED